MVSFRTMQAGPTSEQLVSISSDLAECPEYLFLMLFHSLGLAVTSKTYEQMLTDLKPAAQITIQDFRRMEGAGTLHSIFCTSFQPLMCLLGRHKYTYRVNIPGRYRFFHHFQLPYCYRQAPTSVVTIIQPTFAVCAGFLVLVHKESYANHHEQDEAVLSPVVTLSAQQNSEDHHRDGFRSFSYHLKTNGS